MESIDREFCLRCLRAQSVCFCAELKPFAAEPIVAILIHPKERRKRVGTARMAHLCISNSLLIEGIDFTHNERVNALINDERYFPMVLYPAEGAVVINSPGAMATLVPKARRPLIFVVDGTWYGARRILKLSSNLTRLPWLSFTSERKSGYRFRKQPRPEFFSTIEAIHFVLDSIVETSTAHDNLLEVFNWMVEKQCSFNTPGTSRAIRGPRSIKSAAPQIDDVQRKTNAAIELKNTKP